MGARVAADVALDELHLAADGRQAYARSTCEDRRVCPPDLGASGPEAAAPLPLKGMPPAQPGEPGEVSIGGQQIGAVSSHSR